MELDQLIDVAVALGPPWLQRCQTRRREIPHGRLLDGPDRVEDRARPHQSQVVRERKGRLALTGASVVAIDDVGQAVPGDELVPEVAGEAALEAEVARTALAGGVGEIARFGELVVLGEGIRVLQLQQPAEDGRSCDGRIRAVHRLADPALVQRPRHRLVVLVRDPGGVDIAVQFHIMGCAVGRLHQCNQVG